MTNVNNDEVAWRLAMRWLTVPDIGSARSVCKSWNEMLAPNQEGGDLWKQICCNTHGKDTIQAILVGDAAGSKPAVDFHHICKQFVEPEPQDINLRPTLSLDDIFVVVELLGEESTRPTDGDAGSTKKRRVILWSWTIDFKDYDEALGCTHVTESFDSHFDVTNPFHSSSWEGNSFPHDRLEQLVEQAESQFSDDRALYVAEHLSRFNDKLRLTLFRRDNMKSVCMVLDRSQSTLNFDEALFEKPCHLEAQECSNRAWSALGYHVYFVCFLEIILCDYERAWDLLQRAVRDPEARGILSNKDSFRAEIRTCGLNIWNDGDDDRLESHEEIACVLEALRWR